jgi:hypothetical protein
MVGVAKILPGQGVKRLSCLFVMGDNRAEHNPFEHVIVFCRL